MKRITGLYHENKRTSKVRQARNERRGVCVIDLGYARSPHSQLPMIRKSILPPCVATTSSHSSCDEMKCSVAPLTEADPRDVNEPARGRPFAAFSAAAGCSKRATANDSEMVALSVCMNLS